MAQGIHLEYDYRDSGLGPWVDVFLVADKLRISVGSVVLSPDYVKRVGKDHAAVSIIAEYLKKVFDDS